MKVINFRANEVSGGLGSLDDSFKAAKLLRETADVGRDAMGGLPPQTTEQDKAIQAVGRAEFDQRIKAEEKARKD